VPSPTAPPTNRAATWRRVQPWVSTLARLGLVAVWLISGIAKVTDLTASGRAVHAYELTPYDLSMLIGTILPFLELALALLLLVGLGVRPVAVASAGLLVLFIAGLVSAWARSLSIDCGCFGGGGQLGAGEDPQYGLKLARDLGFLVLAGFLVLFPASRFSVDRWLGLGRG
jgi:uncharacterized membrane protein YphA (DoxX/SURF4 family)